MSTVHDNYRDRLVANAAQEADALVAGREAIVPAAHLAAAHLHTF